MASAVTGKCFSTPNSCCNWCDKFTKDKKVDTSKRIKQLEVVVGSSFSSQAQESQPTTPSLNQIHGPLSASLSASRMLQVPASKCQPQSHKYGSKLVTFTKGHKFKLVTSPPRGLKPPLIWATLN